MDAIDWALLRALQRNARASYSSLAHEVKLSVPSVIERIRKLEDAGVITGYQAQVNAEALGTWIKALVRFEGTGQQMFEITEAVKRHPEVIEAYRMTGDTCFAAVVQVESTKHLEQLLDQLGRYGRSHTSIIVSEPVRGGQLEAVIDRRTGPE